MQYGIGPNATSHVASTTPIGTIPVYNNAEAADMAKRKKARSKGCRFVKGGGCLCNGRFAKKGRCRR